MSPGLLRTLTRVDMINDRQVACAWRGYRLMRQPFITGFWRMYVPLDVFEDSPELLRTS